MRAVATAITKARQPHLAEYRYGDTRSKDYVNEEQISSYRNDDYSLIPTLGAHDLPA